MLTLEFDLVRVVYDADTLLREALRLRPDLVVIEAELSLRDEFRATREIMRRLPDTKIIHHATDAEAGAPASIAADDGCDEAAGDAAVRAARPGGAPRRFAVPVAGAGAVRAASAESSSAN